LTNMTALKSNN